MRKGAVLMASFFVKEISIDFSCKCYIIHLRFEYNNFTDEKVGGS